MSFHARLVDQNPNYCFWVPDSQTVQNGLLVLTVALSALSLLPYFNFETALALRSVSFLSASSTIYRTWSHDTTIGNLRKCVRIGLIAVALVATVLGVQKVTAFAVGGAGSLAAFDMAQSAKEGRKRRFLMQLGSIVANSLSFSALLIGSWQLSVAASAVSATVMGTAAMGILSRAKNVRQRNYGLCYLALSALGIYGTIQASKL